MGGWATDNSSGSNWKIYPTRAGVATAREGDGVKATRDATENDLTNCIAQNEYSETLEHNGNSSWTDELDTKYLDPVDWYSGDERTWAATILKDFMVRRIKYTHDHPHVRMSVSSALLFPSHALFSLPTT